MVQTLSDQRVVSVSTGFQHCLYLNDRGEVYGMGKNNRYQMGKKKNED
jgi:alpha-tubulin suppressor-like RCC1 family protein